MRKWIAAVVALALMLVAVPASEPHTHAQCVVSEPCQNAVRAAAVEATRGAEEHAMLLQEQIAALQDQLRQVGVVAAEYKALKDAEVQSLRERLAQYESIPQDAVTLQQAEKSFLEWVQSNPGGVRRTYRQIAAQGADQFCMFAEEVPLPE